MISEFWTIFILFFEQAELYFLPKSKISFIEKYTTYLLIADHLDTLVNSDRASEIMFLNLASLIDYRYQCVLGRNYFFKGKVYRRIQHFWPLLTF